jgi:hypothetical protein
MKAKEAASRIDHLVEQTIAADAARDSVEAALGSVVRDIDPIAKELGVPGSEILTRLRDFYGYDTPELRLALASLTPSDPHKKRPGASPGAGPRA